MATLSRLLLAVTCLGSAAIAFRIAFRGQSKYRPHAALIALSSIWFGWAMMVLAVGWWWAPPPFSGSAFVGSLNSGAALTVAGWATLGYRGHSDRRKLR